MKKTITLLCFAALSFSVAFSQTWSPQVSGTANNLQWPAWELESESEPSGETSTVGAFGDFLTLPPTSENAQK